jgi:hypothetical protein
MSNAGESFDYIFIDGSHFADDVMLDAVMAWQLLRKDGVLVFDDYLWRLEQYGWKKNPANAINLFLGLVEGDFVLLHVGHLRSKSLYQPRATRNSRCPALTQDFAIACCIIADSIAAITFAAADRERSRAVVSVPRAASGHGTQGHALNRMHPSR